MKYHADSVRGIVERGQTVIEFIGNVEFSQDSLKINSDKARRYQSELRWEFWEQVRIKEGKKWLNADRVVYFEKSKTYKAFDNVIMGDEPTELTAKRITYTQAEDLAIAEENVVITNHEKRTKLTCGKARYFRNEEYAKATESPILVEFDSLQAEKLRVESNIIELYQSENRFKATEEVRIFREKTRATCGETEYFRDENWLELRQNPVVLQDGEEMKGDTIQLFFDEDKLIRARVVGKASVTSSVDSVWHGKRINSLSGGEITLFFANEEVEKVIVAGTATSTYHVIEDGKEKGANEVQGDRIVLFVENSELKRVIVESEPGMSTGKFMPPGQQAPPSKPIARTPPSAN